MGRSACDRIHYAMFRPPAMNAAGNFPSLPRALCLERGARETLPFRPAQLPDRGRNTGGDSGFRAWAMPTRGCFATRLSANSTRSSDCASSSGKEIKTFPSTGMDAVWVENHSYVSADDDRGGATRRLPASKFGITYVFPTINRRRCSAVMGIPKDPRRNETFQDGSMVSLYHPAQRGGVRHAELSGNLRKKLADRVDFPSIAIPADTRRNDALSPDAIRQKAVLPGRSARKCSAFIPARGSTARFTRH